MCLGNILQFNPGITSAPITTTPTRCVLNTSLLKLNSLCNPVLAFIIVFRMKGDCILNVFYLSFSIKYISDALKSLWDHSHMDLEAQGFTFHQCRGSDKIPMGDLIINDLMNTSVCYFIFKR